MITGIVLLLTLVSCTDGFNPALLSGSLSWWNPDPRGPRPARPPLTCWLEKRYLVKLSS